MKHNEENKLGMNRTGIMMSPLDAAETAEGAIELTKVSPYDVSIDDNRVTYMVEADPQGTLPMPGTVKGAINSLSDKIQNGGYILIDKLGERLAFERTGTRLYDALLTKYLGTEDKDNLPPVEVIQKIRNDELEHFQLVSECIKSLGADPTAITPCANVTGTAAIGWMQVLTDPRTSFEQCLGIILMAELADTDGWELLISITQNAGFDEMAQKFLVAYREEEEHLTTIRDWIEQFAMIGDSGLDVVAQQ